MFSRVSFGLLAVIVALPAVAAPVTIDVYTFELDQFIGAAVTYRPDGDVDFDGKLWDNEVGVDQVSLGELASGQYGSDPGDQITLQDRTTPDWFVLTYGGAGLTIGGAGGDTFVVYEITSSSAGVDTEGTSWRISFNGGAFIDASLGTATFLAFTPAAENVNQIAFDLTSFGFSSGDLLTSVRIENTDTGSGTSDPDFIFAALETEPPALPAAGAWAIAALGMMLLLGLVARSRWTTKASSHAV